MAESTTQVTVWTRGGHRHHGYFPSSGDELIRAQLENRFGKPDDGVIIELPQGLSGDQPAILMEAASVEAYSITKKSSRTSSRA